LERVYADSNEADPATIERLLDGIARSGGLTKTRDAIAGYVERAKQSLAPLGSAPARAELGALADALARDSSARTR
jgi:geranylgeranyl pyrophosphate synthase